MHDSSVTPWTVSSQVPLSMEFSRQEYWSGFPFPSPGDLPDRRIETTSLASPALEGGVFTTQSAGKTQTEGRTTGVDAAEFTSTLDFSRFVFATEVQLCELDYLPFLFFFFNFCLFGYVVS